MAIENYEKLRNAMLSSLIESKYADDIARLIELRAIEDIQAQPDLVRLITDRALSDEAVEFTEYPHARADLATRALYLNGFNPQGEDFGLDITEKEFVTLLESAIGREGFVDDGTVKLLLNYQNDKDSYAINDKVKGYLDKFLEENIERVIDIADKNEISHQPVVIESNHGAPTDPTPDESEPLIPANELVSENSMDQSVAVVERADLDYAPDYQKDVDREVEARKRISQVINAARMGDPENNKPSVILVERRVIDKLKSFAENKLADALDPVPLEYPSESLFSSSLSEMDDNGRVTKVHLHYRKDKVVMPSANSPKEVYDIMAAKVLEKGIKHPYLKANFRDPRHAEKFIRETISSLTALGYDIEDMRVHPKHEVLFENIKAEYLDMVNTIEEAPEELSNEQSLDNKTPTQAEINECITPITAERIKVENSVPVEQFSVEQLDEILSMTPYLSSQGLDENGDEMKLTQRNADTVKIGVEYVEKLVNKITGERGLGAREAEKLSGINAAMLADVLKDKPDLLAAYNDFKANYQPSNSNQNDNSQQGNAPQDNYPQGHEPQGNAPHIESNSHAADGFAPEDSQPLTEPPPAPPIESLMDDPMYGEQSGDRPDSALSEHYGNNPDENSRQDENNAPQVEQNAEQTPGQMETKPELSSGDKYMMSMAKGAKNADGDFGYMSGKQIKGVAVLSSMASLPDGHEKKVNISDASKATVEKIKESVSNDISKMASGERVSKQRYAALASLSNRAVIELAGESALATLTDIKERNEKSKKREAPQSEAPQSEAPQSEEQKPVIEGVKGLAMDDFSLPPSSDEPSQEYDIPKADKTEKPTVDLRVMSPDDIEKLQSENPDVVKAAVEFEMSKSDVLPDAQNKFVENLPDSVKANNSEVLGLNSDTPDVPNNAIENKQAQEMDEPEAKRERPTPKMRR